MARLAGGTLPLAMGSLIRIAAIEDRDELFAGLRREGFIKDHVQVDPDALLDYLSPFVEPTRVERFRFSRDWMRTQFARINNPRDPSYTLALKLNLPPSYLLIHRTWLGGIGVLSQLEAEAPFRQILTDSLPDSPTPPDPASWQLWPRELAELGPRAGSLARELAVVAPELAVLAPARPRQSWPHEPALVAPRTDSSGPDDH